MPVEALKAMGADVEGALEHVNVPSYVIDRAGVVRWMNEAAREGVGNRTRHQFTSVVAPEDTRRARELFARKILGNTKVTDAPVVVVGLLTAGASPWRSARYRCGRASTWSGCSVR